MSDYISKSALLERFRKDNRYSRHGFVSENYIDCLIKEFPTVDEKEIIRKTVERVVERLEEMRETFDDEWLRTLSASAYQGRETIDMVKQVLKEECGINE